MELLKKYSPDLIRIFLAFLFGITAYLLLSNGIYVFIPGTSVLTDVREIFVSLAAALLGIPGGILVAVLSSWYDPEPSLRLYITLQHIVAILWVSISYRWMYKRFSMPYLIVAWLVMIAFYYYVIYLPLFSVLYFFYPELYTTFFKESVGFFADMITLFNGWISESLFTAFYTSLVLIALPKNLRIPWGMKPLGTTTSLFISPPTSPWYVKLQDNFLGIRITLWFMLLGYFPITTIGMAVSGQVQQQFIEQSKNIHFIIAKYFAEGLTEKSPKTILTQLRTIQPDSGYIYIVLNDKGSIVFSSNPNIESTNDYSIIEKYRATILGSAEGALYDAATGRMLAFSHVRGKEYHSVVLHKGLAEDFLPFITVEWLQYNRLGALIILLSFAMGLIMWGVVTRPLKLFAKSVHQIGKGDLSVKVDVETIDDEIAKLGTSFNDMAANLSLSQESTMKEIREKLLIAESKQQVERQLQEAQKYQTLGTLAGGIAHDFNNILGIVLANAWLVHDSVKDDTTKQKKRLQSIINAAGRGTSLVKQLLMFARKADVKMTQLNIKVQVDEIVTMLHETFPRNIELISDITDTHLEILGDATQIHQVLLNLFVNARDAMPHGGKLTVTAIDVPVLDAQKYFTAADRARYGKITVSDTGTGIDRSILTRVFDPFFTTKGVGKGTGLGLSVVKSIIEQHNGYIGIESSNDIGTTFIILLPLIAATVEHAGYIRVDVETIPQGKGTILLIDDEVDFMDAQSALLKNKGYTVLHAGDGQQGIDLFKKYNDRIDLVITDYGLPTVSGETVIHKIVAIKPRIKTIVMSGFLEPETRARLEELGNGIIIEKPFTPTDLIKLVQKMLGANV